MGYYNDKFIIARAPAGGAPRFFVDFLSLANDQSLTLAGWLGIGTTPSFPLHLVATQSSGPAISSYVDIATSGTDATYRIGSYTRLTAGFTGAAFTVGGYFYNTTAGTDTSYSSDSYGYRPGGNQGVYGGAFSTTVGINQGMQVGASGGNTNYGLWSNAVADKDNAKNMAVLSSGATRAQAAQKSAPS